MSGKSILELAGTPERIRKLSFSQMNLLAREVRGELIQTISKTGGHLASNLGVVELTLALLHCLHLPQDKIVWDVGHQCYAYKLLTGRRDRFKTLRQEGGLSGFPKTAESAYDSFISGHASTSLAVAFGLKRAMTMQSLPHHVVAVIGDGSMTGGMAYEGINNIGKSGENLIVVLNDNEMAISRNEGALAKHLSVIRSNPSYFKAKKATDAALRSIPVVGESLRTLVWESKMIAKKVLYPSTFFEEFGFTYYGPIDGHNIKALCEVLAEAKLKREPALIHVKTTKGKGYPFAEKNPGEYHGVSSFNIADGEPTKMPQQNFSEVFGDQLLQLGRKHPEICAVTAAMEHGTALHHFAREFKAAGRYYDVGIAEEMAVTFSAALAAGGALPVLALYSTFLQRGYDQLIHDAAIEKRRMILAVDRAGIVGEDGETHQGIFDAAFLQTVPGIEVYAPANYLELQNMMEAAVCNATGPVAIRYPRGAQDAAVESYRPLPDSFHHLPCGKKDTLVVTFGRTFSEALKAKKLTKTPFSIVKLNRITPIDPAAVDAALGYKRILFIEEGIQKGGIGMQFIALLAVAGFKGAVQIQAISDFVPQGKVETMLHKLGLDAAGIAKAVDL